MIQWFPGHMAKARREIEQNVRLVDLIIELVDARVPQSSQNPLFQEIIADKEQLLVLMKADLANEQINEQWITYYKNKGKNTMAIDVNNQQSIHQLVNLVYDLGIRQQKAILEKGVHKRPIRALIVGIPNVGKSTLINRLAGRRIAKIGDRPGITKMQQWIKVQQKFELLDTPGVLWPKFSTEDIGLKLAAIGTIKDDLIPLQDVAAYIIQVLLEIDKDRFYKRYEFVEETVDMWEIFTHIGKKRGALQSGGRVNFDQVALLLLREFRSGKLGKISLEKPQEFI